MQNLLLLRFTNGLFEPIWNRRYVDHVQIVVAETLGTEGRGAYYDGSGAMRDMLQNHMLQLLCLIAMEPPISFAAEQIRNEKVKVLEAIGPVAPEDIPRVAVRGQYGPGTIDGKAVPGYREEPDVPDDSITDTFAALRLEVDNWRWAGVPFYLRTGKRLPLRETEITIQFRRAPLILLPAAQRQPPNRMVIHVQPDERIALHFHAKCPGPQVRLAPVEMTFTYSDLDGDERAHRLRNAALRRHDGRRDVVPPCRHDRRRLARREPRPRRVGRGAARRLPELRRRHLGTAVRRGADRARRPLLARTAAVTIAR